MSQNVRMPVSLKISLFGKLQRGRSPSFELLQLDMYLINFTKKIYKEITYKEFDYNPCICMHDTNKEPFTGAIWPVPQKLYNCLALPIYKLQIIFLFPDSDYIVHVQI